MFVSHEESQPCVTSVVSGMTPCDSLAIRYNLPPSAAKPVAECCSITVLLRCYHHCV